jgi:hypothetical protein
MSREQKKPQKVIIPDQLNIKIRTSVPGYQKIDYKPSMTIKDSDEKSVRFNPLIKLNQSTIDKIPKEYRIKQFFNIGLFQSLLNFNGGTPANSLLQATRNGYVDNNIKVTLNSIFPVGSVIYIDKKPYAIADYQWTTGDWKIDIKQKKQEIEQDKVTEPQLYSQLGKDEIITGEEQLNKMPKDVLFGTNYFDPKPKANYQQPISKHPSEIDKDKIQISKHQASISIPNNLASFTQQSRTTQPTIGQPTTGESKIQRPLVSSELVPKFPLKQPSITNDSTQNTIKDFLPESESEPEYLSTEEERLFDTFKNELENNSQSTNFFKDYFKSLSFKTIVQLIFSKFPTNLKTQIRAFYFFVTNYEPLTKTDKLSNKSYENLCDQV